MDAPPHLHDPLGRHQQGEEKKLEIIGLKTGVEGHGGNPPGGHVLGQGLGRMRCPFKGRPLVEESIPLPGQEEGRLLQKKLHQASMERFHMPEHLGVVLHVVHLGHQGPVKEFNEVAELRVQRHVYG